MQKYCQQGSPAGAWPLSRDRARQVHIGDVVGAVAVPKYQVGRPSGPGQHVGWSPADVARTTLTIHSTAIPETFMVPRRNSIIMNWILPAKALGHFSQSGSQLMLREMAHADG
jgi:hypothetical protein